MSRRPAIRRRAFIKAAALAPVLASHLPSADAADKFAGELPLRTLGKTGLQLPILGYGGAGLPTKWGNPLSREDRVTLLRHAYDGGVRYFDTAPCYFESQAIMGEALRDRRRDVCLATKVRHQSCGGAQTGRDVAQSAPDRSCRHSAHSWHPGP